MAATRTFVSAVIAFLSISSPFCLDAQKSGFSIDLIHRDSPESPFYDANESLYEQIAKSFKRSTPRVLRLGQNAHLDTVESEITVEGKGEYLMNISIGTPAINIIALADTGSDLIWTQCKPCPKCYSQEAPLFDPKKSSTYKDVACSSPQCKYLGKGSACSKSDPSCLYSISYADGSSTKGNLAVDTVTLGSTNHRPVAFPKTIVGCGHNNAGKFSSKSSGTVGLGGGALSLTSQLSDSINGKFSYCLVPLLSQGKKSSRLNFGGQAVVSGNGAVTTPLIKGTPDTYYFINMKAISVNDKKIPFSSGPAPGTSGGNMVIDSGTSLTYLPTSVYSAFESAVAGAIVGKKVKSPVRYLSLCYDAASVVKGPKIKMHLDGADVELKAGNVLVPLSYKIMCLAFAGTNKVAVYGSVAQMNFLIGYDRKAGKLSFKPADCSKA